MAEYFPSAVQNFNIIVDTQSSVLVNTIPVLVLCSTSSYILLYAPL